MNIAKHLIQIVTGVGAVLSLSAGKVMALTAQEGAEVAKADGMPSDLVGVNGALNQFTNIALYVIGFISVVMLIWGGLRYIISGGDSKKITDAKNTILYALIGLIVAFLAYAIVNFVLNAIGTVSTPEGAQETSQAIIQLLT